MARGLGACARATRLRPALPLLLPLLLLLLLSRWARFTAARRLTIRVERTEVGCTDPAGQQMGGWGVGEFGSGTHRWSRRGRCSSCGFSRQQAVAALAAMISAPHPLKALPLTQLLLGCKEEGVEAGGGAPPLEPDARCVHWRRRAGAVGARAATLAGSAWHVFGGHAAHCRACREGQPQAKPAGCGEGGSSSGGVKYCGGTAAATGLAAETGGAALPDCHLRGLRQ